MEGFRYVGNVNEVNFSLGINPPISTYDVDSLEINSALPTTLPEDVYNPTSGFVMFELTLLNLADSTRQNLTTESSLTSIVEIELLDVAMELATDEDISIQVEFQDLIEGISFENTTDENLSIALENFPFIFSQN